jgi:hypothetical protein
VEELKSTTANGSWKKLWPEASNEFHLFPKQQEKIRNILILAFKLLGEGF